MIFRVLIILTVLGVLLKADDSTKRNKRFFNLNSYFKSTTDVSSADSVITVQSRNVKILNPEKLCVDGKNCTFVTIAKFETSSNVVTPASYLTPPSVWSEPFRGLYYLPSEDQNQVNLNGYSEYNAMKNMTVYPSGNEENTQKDIYYSGASADTQINKQPLNVKLKDIICIKSAKNGRFTVRITTSKSLPAIPVLENGYTTDSQTQCSVTTLDSTTFQLHIQEPDMINCGVYYCDSDVETNLMCITIRFPLIPGIRTRDDALMKIECRPQQQLVSQTRQFNLKPSHINLNGARSLPLHATITGGNPNPELRVQMGFYTLTKSGFTQPLSNNDVIAVGDEIQLRAIVRQGDGWYYSRFGQVLVHHVPQSGNGYTYGENPDSVVIVADDGCVSQQMKPICPFGPINDPANPLISTMNIQMFTFNNMKDGDELTMSVTIYGCIHYEDCFPRNNLCQEWTSARYKRSTLSSTNNITDSISEIRLRVMKSSKIRRLITCNKDICQEMSARGLENPIIAFSLVIICIIVLIAFLIFYYLSSDKVKYSVNNLYYS